MATQYNFLKPYTFKNGVTVKNRIVIPPMTEAAALENGAISQDELRYFDIHTGGVGMFIAPVMNVSDDGKGFEGEPSVADDKFMPGLKKLANTMKQNGTKAILQIFHAGRMSNSKILRGVQPVSASAVAALRPNAETPRELTNDEIEQIIEDFGQATRRAIQAGFDGIELHGANTYLMQQFFSPHSNRRTDKWGGSLENRMRFGLEIIKRVHQAVEEYGDDKFIVGYRISPEEIEEPGIRLDDTLKFIDVLADQPIDYLHVSMGYAWRASLNDKSDTEPIVLKIKETVNGRLPLISVGSIETPADAEKVIDAGIDFAAIGRESIRDPKWVQKVELGQEDSINYQLSLTELDELGINSAFLDFLYALNADLHLVGSDRPKDDFVHNMGGVEGN
ncbi:NADH-dependent flavin oxidoreductase [Companilactobacillus sp.]|jgi:2,4-dienoyl-CoA reductase-like NADH-dependent reductase (Old Yellow Enzyme family)|uniref:NADH-dependent flavin oxidoreductase n=1 Tax=Companilactobacillus sp. TaxID=2767905 RepID=UPI0025BD37D8|nr:NADH-dependent flavin oxidoreductase [Companilactobacillus sp.]MCH4009289.1 NADH-dependent flavin oxidoreductase [Companilactobacillus sp.]MCH4050532.1 NADH-dependent flavin oxidoreductase [Companilactobacillus sp.]MCH4077231.1 NADH-dependent flavin oxidoreductase [Companilactobacillus sp.]MCH4125807.1 NADH-dependent flavin oxidoreductase [Companilactobacillus sp.]MCI1311516.1 NADH-dependent flavin oxidoreductase [Companilactobacillus sp.]